MNSALGFIKEYSHRINYILSLPAQVFAPDSLEASKREGYLSSIQEKPSSFKFTAAVNFYHNIFWVLIVQFSTLKNWNAYLHCFLSISNMPKNGLSLTAYNSNWSFTISHTAP